jgi:hypothetical protein
MLPLILFPIFNSFIAVWNTYNCFQLMLDREDQKTNLKNEVATEVAKAVRAEMNKLSSRDYICLQKYAVDNKHMYC